MRLVGSKLLQVLPVLLLVSALTFGLVDILPGDPSMVVLGQDATEEQVEAFREAEGLDDPMLMRFGTWMGEVLRGDLGRSFRTGQPVAEAIVDRLPVSIQLMLLAQVLGLGLAIPLAMIAAYRAGGRFDRFTSAGAFTFISIAPFMLALLLVYVFSLQFGWFPATGFVSIFEDPFQGLRHLLLPALSLALTELAVYHRLLRSDMVATLQEDYIAVARASGLPTWHILLRHALRPSSFSLITLAGVSVARLIGGSVIVEVIFGLPGLGRLLIDAIFTRDIFIVQGVVLVAAVSYVAINTLVDLFYAVLDPRVRVAS